ncbi:MAG TPA: right-handed parallel beta-helix repeat-containing protein [Steroidobacteraceae bacterium]|nr:right-handed parallel beta-helix repeat-containing protein [Steroidobacteraceae bacterium]
MRGLLGINAILVVTAALSAGPSPALATSPTQDLNVKVNCGAAGDGSTDDTSSIQSCINTAQTSGQGIYFPIGTYKITAALTISAGNMLLYGSNEGTTKIVQYTLGANVFTIANGGSPVNRVTIRHMQLDYSGTGATGLTIYCDNCWRAHFDHLVFGDPGAAHLFSTGIWANGGNEVFVEDSEFDLTASQGMYFTGTGDVYLSNLEINDDSSDTTVTGVVFDSGVGGIYATNVNVTSGETGFLFENSQSGGIPPKFGFFVNCLGDTLNGDGWDFEAGESMRLTNSWAATGNYGIILNNVNGISIMDSRIYNNSQAGIWIEPSAVNVTIEGSSITGNSRSSTGASPGVLVSAGAGQFQIEDNEIGEADGFGNTQSYGILISSGASDNFTIAGNHLQNNVNGELSNGGTGSHVVIANNL